MKKNILAIAAAVAIVAATLTSCATASTGAALSDKAPIGSKVGEAKSSIILGLWSSKGEENNIKQAAENGGIQKVSQVEYINQTVLFGLFIKRTTRVYGE